MRRIHFPIVFLVACLSTVMLGHTISVENQTLRKMRAHVHVAGTVDWPIGGVTCPDKYMEIDPGTTNSVGTDCCTDSVTVTDVDKKLSVEERPQRRDGSRVKKHGRTASAGAGGCESYSYKIIERGYKIELRHK